MKQVGETLVPGKAIYEAASLANRYTLAGVGVSSGHERRKGQF